MATPRVLLAPDGVRSWIADAIRAGGGELVSSASSDASDDAADADVLVWAEVAHPEELADLLQSGAKTVRWVQLPWAGVEPYADIISRHADRVWTCAKGVYAQPVAEHALTLLLAGLRGLSEYGRATTWGGPRGTNLAGKVVILGGGGITEHLLRMLAAFPVDVTVVRRDVNAVPPLNGVPPLAGAHHVVPVAELDAALEDAIGVVLALALTPETEGIIGRRQLERMRSDGWIVNVARGRHIVTDDLVAALDARVIGGAALDVTDPEPLPDGHPLWTCPNCIITPHVGNTPEMALPLLTARITENVSRWGRGEPLLGLVDPALGY
jgi:phosphoglycerate dehydrogenase-like enzyme